MKEDEPMETKTGGDSGMAQYYMSKIASLSAVRVCSNVYFAYLHRVA